MLKVRTKEDPSLGKKVKEILKKFGNVNEDKVLDIESSNMHNYRNKVTLHGSNNALGYCESGSNSVFGTEKCLLADEKINEVMEVVKGMTYTEKIEELLIRTNNESDEVMVSLKGEINDYECLNNLVDTFRTFSFLLEIL